MMINEFGEFIWVRSYQMNGGQEWRDLYGVQFSGKTTKTIVALSKRRTTPNIAVHKWSYEGDLLWASMSVFSELDYIHLSYELDIDEQESIYFSLRDKNTAGFELHLAHFKLASDGSSLDWVIDMGQ